ncbi:MAG: hypothetical protein WCA21_12760 [Terracidiphilus sp.]|jgi:hypothetical protein
MGHKEVVRAFIDAKSEILGKLDTDALEDWKPRLNHHAEVVQLLKRAGAFVRRDDLKGYQTLKRCVQNNSR